MALFNSRLSLPDKDAPGETLKRSASDLEDEGGGGTSFEDFMDEDDEEDHIHHRDVFKLDFLDLLTLRS